MSREQFVSQLQDLLLKASDLSVCERLELSLVELSRIAVAESGSTQIGLSHLSSHLETAANSLEYEEWRKGLH